MKTFSRLLVAVLLFHLTHGVLHADNGYNFDITLAQKKAGQGEKQQTAGATFIRENWGFTVTVENHSFKDVPACEIKYVVFRKPEGSGNSSKAHLQRVEGSVTVPGILNNDKFVFDTKTVEIHVQQLQPGYVWSGSGSTGNLHDKLRGIWLRVYIGDQVVFEFINPPELKSRGETFEAPAQ